METETFAALTASWPLSGEKEKSREGLPQAGSPSQRQRLSEAGTRERDRLEMYGGIGDIWRDYGGAGRPMASTNRALAFGEK